MRVLTYVFVLRSKFLIDRFVRLIKILMIKNVIANAFIIILFSGLFVFFEDPAHKFFQQV